MSDRDELAIVIANSATSWDKYGARYEDAADAVLAAGYRKPRTITTAEEIDALPDMAVVMDGYGICSNIFRGNPRIQPSDYHELLDHGPIVVIHEGGAA